MGPFRAELVRNSGGGFRYLAACWILSKQRVNGGELVEVCGGFLATGVFGVKRPACALILPTKSISR